MFKVDESYDNPLMPLEVDSGGGSGSTGVRVGIVTNGGTFPTSRLDGSPLQNGDYVAVSNSSIFPFTIDSATFTSSRDKGIYDGNSWQVEAGISQDTDETPLSDGSLESLSGNASMQNIANKEFVTKLKTLGVVDIVLTYLNHTTGDADITAVENVYQAALTRNTEIKNASMLEHSSRTEKIAIGTHSTVFLKSLEDAYNLFFDGETRVKAQSDIFVNGVPPLVEIHYDGDTGPKATKLDPMRNIVNEIKNYVVRVSNRDSIQSYDTSNLSDGDRIAVLKDEQHSNLATLYEYNGTDLIYIGSVQDSSSEPTEYESLERLGEYLHRITFDNIPAYKPSNIVSPVGACTSFIMNGKMYRSFDLTYDEIASFEVITKNFKGMARIQGIEDGDIDTALLGQLPYHLSCGVNNDGIMVSEHILFNDFGFDGTGTKSNDMTLLPYIILSNAHSISDISTNTIIQDFLNNMAVPTELESAEYILHYMVSDGITTHTITPKTDGSGYEIIDISSLPKLTNFKWVNKATLARNDSLLQDRPTGVERWNLIDSSTTLADLRFTKCYEAPNMLSEYIGEEGTDKDSTDSELEAIYNIAHSKYVSRTRNGQTFHSVYSVAYSPNGIEHLYAQENYNRDYANSMDGFVPDTRKIAGIDLKNDISKSDMKEAVGLSCIDITGEHGTFTQEQYDLLLNNNRVLLRNENYVYERDWEYNGAMEYYVATVYDPTREVKYTRISVSTNKQWYREVLLNVSQDDIDDIEQKTEIVQINSLSDIPSTLDNKNLYNIKNSTIPYIYKDNNNAEYEELEYIEGNNTTSYFNTKFKATDKCDIDTVLCLTDLRHIQLNAFGIRGSNKGGHQSIGYLTGYTGYADANTYWYMSAYNTGWTKNQIPLDTKYHRFRTDYLSKKGYFDEKEVFQGDNTTFTQSYNFPIFSIISAGTSYSGCHMRMKYFILRDNGIKVRDYIPVKNISTNEVGIFDKVNNEFYSRSGTGSFIGGPVKTYEIGLYKVENNKLIKLLDNGDKKSDIVQINTLEEIPNQLEFDKIYDIRNDIGGGLYRGINGHKYQELEYIVSDGTQYIKLDKGFPDIYKYEYTVLKNDTTNINTFMGVYGSSAYTKHLVQFNNNGVALFFSAGDATVYTNLANYSANAKHTIRFTKEDNIIRMFNNEGTELGYVENAGTCTSTEPFYLFTYNNAGAVGGQYWKGRFYSLKIYDATNDIVNNFIPVRDIETMECGVYDTVENKFYANQGTGIFFAGSTVSYEKGYYVVENNILVKLVNPSDLDAIPKTTYYGTCSSGRDDAVKEITCPEFKLQKGAIVVAKTTTRNNASPISFNVNNTGVFPMDRETNLNFSRWEENAVLTLMFTGEAWLILSVKVKQNWTSKGTTSGNCYVRKSENILEIDMSDACFSSNTVSIVAGEERIDYPAIFKPAMCGNTEWSELQIKSGALRYRRNDDLVEINMVGASANGSNFGQLPEGYRPDYPVIFKAGYSSNLSPVSRIIVETDGSISCNDAPDGNQDIYLNIVYSVDGAYIEFNGYNMIIHNLPLNEQHISGRFTFLCNLQC